MEQGTVINFSIFMFRFNYIKLLFFNKYMCVIFSYYLVHVSKIAT